MPGGLYPQLLGSAWHDLDEAVRRLHLETDLQSAGVFRIRHGSGRLARFLLWLLRMPAAGEVVPVRLAISRCQSGECWLRTFAGQLLGTTQYAKGDLLAERVGVFELRFRLRADAGALVYHQASAALCLGPLRIRLPNRLAPHVAAREEPNRERDGTAVSVRVQLPLIGLLISYDGTMVQEP